MRPAFRRRPRGLPRPASPGFLALLLALPAFAEPSAAAPAAAAPAFADSLADRCEHCHSEDYSEAELRLDTAGIQDASAEFWKLVLKRVERGEMPPADEGPLTPEEKQALVAGLSAKLEQALSREAPPPTPLVRRLTKRQYAATLHELLGVPECVADDLPADSRSKLGFTTGVSAEQTSMLHVEYYQSIARRALERAVPVGPRPSVAHYRVTLGDNRFPESQAAVIGGYRSQPIGRNNVGVEVLSPHDPQAKPEAIVRDIGAGARGSDRERYRLVEDGVLLQPATAQREVSPYSWWAPSPNVKAVIRRRYPTSGPFVMRIRARPADDATDPNRPPRLQAFAGSRTDDGLEYLEVGESTPVVASQEPGGWATYEFRGELDDLSLPAINPAERNPLAGVMVVGVWNDHMVRKKETATPSVVVESIELEAPAYQRWHPASYGRVLHASPLRESDPAAYTREVLRRSITRIFRRPAGDDEVERYLALWRSIKGDFATYEEGIRETLVAAFCSPSFLYIGAPADHLSAEEHEEFTLASRLAYFLWDRPPDAELLELAAEGRLSEQAAAQVERMVSDSRADRFIAGFVGQWLRLDRHEAMSINARRYRDYNRFIKEAMGDETRQFFRHLLVNNRPVDELVSADYTMLNRTLADFYQVPGVENETLAPTPVAGARPVGGLLGHGAMLAGHSDGTQPHAIKRAVWLRARLLGDPPPEAPPNVPELEAPTGDTAKLSLTERLALHRDNDSCRSCHAGIDPFGVPMEEFDAVGRLAKRANTASELPDGTKVDGVAALRDYVLKQRRADLVRSVAMHLYAYATGIDPGVHDDAAILQIAAAGNDGGGLRDVVVAVTRSPAFLATNDTQRAQP